MFTFPYLRTVPEVDAVGIDDLSLWHARHASTICIEKNQRILEELVFPPIEPWCYKREGGATNPLPRPPLMFIVLRRYNKDYNDRNLQNNYVTENEKFKKQAT